MSDFAKSAKKNGGTIRPVNEPKKQGIHTFREYFEAVLSEGHPIQLKEALKLEKVKSKKDAVSQYWSRLDVASWEDFELDMLQAVIHNLKCSIMFDSICQAHFKERNNNDLRAALFNVEGGKFVYPKGSTDLKRKWEVEFNILMDVVKDVNIYGANETLLEEAKGRKSSFIDNLAALNSLLKKKALTECEELDLASVSRSTLSIPRPTLRKIEIKNESILERLKGLFFRRGGFLRYDVCSSVDFNQKHGFIRFVERETKDERWFIPLLRVDRTKHGEYNVLQSSLQQHVLKQFGAWLVTENLRQCLFNRVVQCLHMLEICDVDKEEAIEVGLIIGGTVLQPIHFDVAKKKCNEANYDSVMASPYAPASILIGFNNPTRVAVATESIYDSHTAEDELSTLCSIRGGVPNKEVMTLNVEDVAEQTADGDKKCYSVAILQSETGFVFRGDFKHAGVPIIYGGSVMELNAWKKVQAVLMPVLLDERQRYDIGYRLVFNKLCEVASLDAKTRLHVMTKPKDVNFEIPEDTIGYMDEAVQSMVAASIQVDDTDNNSTPSGLYKETTENEDATSGSEEGSEYKGGHEDDHEDDDEELVGFEDEDESDDEEMKDEDEHKDDEVDFKDDDENDDEEMKDEDEHKDDDEGGKSKDIVDGEDEHESKHKETGSKDDLNE